MTKVFILFAFLLLQINAYGQLEKKSVKVSILSADTVLIVSHDLTYSEIIDRKTGKKAMSPPVVVNQRSNIDIIHEKVILSDSLKNQLIRILTKPNGNTKYDMARCFLPHHSILLMKSGKTSYIEICFDCKRLDASKTIETSDIHYSKEMWTELKDFFIRSGIKYQIPHNSEEE
jgi:hypothetical protein